MYYKVHNEINYNVQMQFYKKIIPGVPEKRPTFDLR